MLVPLSNLKIICKLKGACARDLNKKGKDDLVKLIADELNQASAGDQKEQSCAEMFEMKILHNMIILSYLKPSSNQCSESECTKLGHINEKK